ncbi:kinesin-like protein KIN-7N isoform X2 [Magnolia sinica]|uniref:kinesin-like protein KIN-7N isoform X2 n=1 Tax=Magnolia sinica TaxID=86752 RepID=UPI002658A715|nr:kinesin-like protein KIN-7N isoform X2 [Magnolia sinica]
MEKICVAVRVRPPVSQEPPNASHWKVEDNRISLHKALGTPISGLSFTFDHIFDQNCTNARVYELLAKDIIRAAIDGFNGTAFAYGQTSSGKTFTMNGSESDPGITLLAIRDIFQNIEMTTDREFLIRVSYMEIYNEEINDLFAPENHKLQIHESLDRGIFVAGLREEIVNNAEQVLRLIELGEVNRHFGQTNMNIRSSRSHTIFRMVIESRGKDSCSGDISITDAIRVSVLNLVDLAGSERIAKTGAGGVRLKEGKHINKSLMILGNVINKLSDGGKQRGHIPYRDSKLTRILQPALGGNAKTSIICTVAPEEVHIEETRGTLQFASRAKRITNCVQVNEILSDAALLKRQKLEIEELRSQLQGSHSEVLEQEILKLRKDMLKYELEREKLAMELEEERKSHMERDLRIKEQQMKIDNLSSLVTYSDHDRSSSQLCSGEQSFPANSLDSFDKGQVSRRQNHIEECNDNHDMLQEDSFGTPCFKAISNSFVMKRSNYSRLPDSSPLPDNFVNVADEDMWLRMNKGQTTDLDTLHMTPEGKYESLPYVDSTPGYPTEYYKEEVRNLRKQLEHAIEEKNELEKHNVKQITLNNQLLEEISELQQESLLIREIPQRMCESVATCKDIYKDILSIMQSFAAEKNSTDAKLLSSTTDIGMELFSTLETHFLRAVGSDKVSNGESSLIQEQSRILSEKLNAAIATLVSSEAVDSSVKHLSKLQCRSNYEGLAMGEEDADQNGKVDLNTELDVIKESYGTLERECSHNIQLLKASEERCQSLERECNALREEQASLMQAELDVIKESNKTLERECSHNIQLLKASEERCQSLERECNVLRDERTSLMQAELDVIKESNETLERECSHNIQLLKASEERCQSLERECNALREERASLMQALQMSTQSVALVTAQKEEICKHLYAELRKRKNLDEDITRLRSAFAQRQSSFLSFSGECKVKIENMRAMGLVPTPKNRC